MQINPITKRFLDAEERVVQLPVKQGKLRLVLEYLWSKFDAEVRYTEKQVNALLEQWSTLDYASVRREMVDHGYLYRENTGASYWIQAELPEAASAGR